MLIFDLESNGFVAEMDRIHCLVIKDTFTGEVSRYNDQADRPGCQPVSVGVMRLMQATQQGFCIVPHNGIKFDIPAIQKLYPWFKPDMRYVLDTMPLVRLLWPDMKATDNKLIKKGQMPSSAKFKPHALETWGYRLKILKGEYDGDPRIADEVDRKARKWESWNPTMEDYCVQDVEVTEALLWRCFKAILAKGVSAEAVEIEQHVARIIARQERYGVAFDVVKAKALHGQLVGVKLELAAALRQQFGQFYVSKGVVTTKRSARYQVEELGINQAHFVKTGKVTYKTMDFVEGAEYTKLELKQFNPGSRDHIANRLTKLFGWTPTEFTDDGKPKVDEAVLAGIKLPGVENLKQYLMINKRLGQLAEGKEAWLKHERNGRIHGGVNTNGAVTGRMTHSKPNLGQVPANLAPYGEECRSLFIATEIEAAILRVLVGADADALELRDLAGYMAKFDNGAYIKTVLEGRKEDGTDMHSVNCRALGMEPKQKCFDGRSGRDTAKTWFYAFIYGAGDEKLGIILTGQRGVAAVNAGKRSRAAFMRNLPALGKLVERVKQAVKTRGCLRGLDGRVLESRSQHSALNTLLQSAGAVQMKKALIILDTKLQSMGLTNSETCERGSMPDYEFVLNVHDEWQIETWDHLGETIGKEAVQAIVSAGEYFKFRCPLGGAYAVGRTWAETH